MHRDILKTRKTDKHRLPRTKAEMHSRKLQIAQILGLSALVFALFFSLLGLLCGCVGICKLNAVSPSVKSAEYGSARLAVGFGFVLSVLMLLAKSAVFLFLIEVF